MKHINDLQAVMIRWNLRSIEIEWKSEKMNISGISCLYQHSDGSWAVDPETRKCGAEFGEALMKTLMKEFIDTAFPCSDSSYMPQSEIARIEGILRKEEMYRKSLQKPLPPKHRKNPSRIRVWRAE